MRYLSVAIVSLVVIACSTPPHDLQTSTNAPQRGVTGPIVVHRVEPDYPAELRAQGVTGVVTLEALIDKTEQLLNLRVLRSADPRLDDLALAAVRMWRFKPGTANGEPVDVLFQLHVKFSIP